MNPTVGIFAACCACAANGHAAAPPSSVMNSRRFTASASRASARNDSTPQLRHETAALRDFDPAYDRCGSKAALVSCRLQCPVCPKGDIVDCPKGAIPVNCRHSPNGIYGILGRIADHSALMLAARITL